jgi:glycogen synthase kinase 3 beta
VVEMLGSFITHESGMEYLNIMMRHYEENLFKRISFYKLTRVNNLEAKIILYQIFKGLSYLHSLGVCHRDIKPENILLKGSAAAICDFGSAKLLNSSEANISYICARCYRAPELIFGATKYSTVVDIWSAGCVILELLNGEPLFIGETSISHLLEIIKVMGAPTQEEVLEMNPDYCVRDYRFPIIKKK